MPVYFFSILQADASLKLFHYQHQKGQRKGSTQLEEQRGFIELEALLWLMAIFTAFLTLQQISGYYDQELVSIVKNFEIKWSQYE